MGRNKRLLAIYLAHEVFYVKVIVVLVIHPLMSSLCQLNEGKFLGSSCLPRSSLVELSLKKNLWKMVYLSLQLPYKIDVWEISD